MAAYAAPLLDTASTASADRAALKQVFQAVTAESCPRDYNFHLHTRHSDGCLSPADLMSQAVRHGLRGLAITDHHSVGGYRAGRAWLDAWRDRHGPGAPAPQLWSGVEVNAWLADTEVHILGYAFDPDREAMQPYLQGATAYGDTYNASRAIAAIQESGGLAVLAHPARYRQGPETLIPAAAELGIDGVEAYYAYNNPTPWQPSPRQTEQVLALGEAHGLLTTCGTDTHGPDICKRL